jgi:hypothetical protein
MNNNKNHWIYSFDDDKNISFAIASVLNSYYEKNYSFVKNIEEIQAVHNLNKTEAKKVIKKSNEYIERKVS